MGGGPTRELRHLVSLRGSARSEEDGGVAHPMSSRNRVVQEVAELDAQLLPGDMEVGVAPVQLGNASGAPEGVEVQVRG
eukprot:2709256-Alexandrium_andersonii.AAC.1